MDFLRIIFSKIFKKLLDNADSKQGEVVE